MAYLLVWAAKSYPIPVKPDILCVYNKNKKKACKSGLIFIIGSTHQSLKRRIFDEYYSKELPRMAVWGSAANRGSA
ncbi:MAG: hypothetical protein B5M56_06175 [Desulfococcus sp. 4484_241]|nr:MAG: hypothetical protein B5M56_06175 [Desulfococcus sp. 4484_241]